MSTARKTINKTIHKNEPKKRNKCVPVKLKQEVWLKHFGRVFEHKCFIDWCNNTIDVFNFEAGHDIPDSKGGDISLYNLYPICQNCNKSMNNKYTIISSIDGLKDMSGIWNNLNMNEIEMET